MHCVVINVGKIPLAIDENHPQFEKRDPNTSNLAIGYFHVPFCFQFDLLEDGDPGSNDEPCQVSFGVHSIRPKFRKFSVTNGTAFFWNSRKEDELVRYTQILENSSMRIFLPLNFSPEIS